MPEERSRTAATVLTGKALTTLHYTNVIIDQRAFDIVRSLRNCLPNELRAAFTDFQAICRIYYAHLYVPHPREGTLNIDLRRSVRRLRALYGVVGQRLRHRTQRSQVRIHA